jgi:tRNA (cytosine38-C5)-methyltransferase
MEQIVAIEFFSGIGGLHYGLEYASVTAKVVCSFDTNTVANEVYEHNFGLKPSTKGIERLTAEFLDKFNANCWLLSPPCQPYTSGGKRLDDKDSRALGLLNLIKILPQLKQLPKFIFLENVPNFELSNSRNELIATLNNLGYRIDEFLISPLSLGIPNDRRRYYLAACLGNSTESYEINDLSKIHTSPSKYCKLDDIIPLQPLCEYLDTLDDIQDYIVNPDDIRKRVQFKFDVVQPTSKYCSTFTKAYGSHHFFGSGSFLQTENLEVSNFNIDAIRYS